MKINPKSWRQRNSNAKNELRASKALNSDLNMSFPEMHNVVKEELAKKVAARSLNHAVKRNMNRIPEDFMFSLSWEEILRISQSVTSSGQAELLRELMKPPTAAQKREIGFHTNFSNRAIKPRSRTRTKVSP